MKLIPSDRNFLILLFFGPLVAFAIGMAFVAFCVSKEPPFKIITDPVTGIEYLSDMHGGLVRREFK